MAGLMVLLTGLSAAGPAAAHTTLEQTIQQQQSGAFPGLLAGPGEPFVVRRGGFSKAKKGRANRRRSLAYFSQLTDPQIADEMSPLRVEPHSGARVQWRRRGPRRGREP